MKTPIYTGSLQNDLDFAGFKPLNADLSDYDLGGGSGGAMPGVFVNVKDAPYNAVGDGVTDDTVAIQSAINAVITANGGTVFFPRGFYKCNGAFDPTTNSILKIPVVSQSTPTVGIELLGETFSGSLGGLGATTNTFIVSTKTGTGTEPSVLATQSFQGYGYVLYTAFNNILLRIKNLGVYVQNEPSINGFRLDGAGYAILENVQAYGSPVALPVNNMTGIWMPSSGNLAITYAKNTVCSGWGYGMRIGEHFRSPSMMIGACKVGIQFLVAHEPSWANVTFIHCVRFVQFSGTHSVDLHLDIENATPGDPYATTAHIDDPSNYGGGFVRYNLIDAGVGYSTNPFVATGGAKINLMDLYTGATTFKGPLKLFPVTVANLPASPVMGQFAAVSDGTASLAWGATVTGGGSTKYLVWYNGTNWTVAGK